MSTGFDSRETSGFWSYVPFSKNSPRRRSVTLPRANTGAASSSSAPWDPFEKADRHSTSGASGQNSLPTLDSLRNAWMTQSQRARWFKAGGIVSLLILVLYFFTGGSGVANVSGGGGKFNISARYPGRVAD